MSHGYAHHGGIAFGQVIGDITIAPVTIDQAEAGSLTDEQARAAEYLAVETLRSWKVQAKQRLITTPSPVAVRWQWAGQDVAVPADEVGSQIPTSGMVTHLREELYGRLEEQTRIVILGGPGAGKTGAMLVLLLDIPQGPSSRVIASGAGVAEPGRVEPADHDLVAVGGHHAHP